VVIFEEEKLLDPGKLVFLLAKIIESTVVMHD